MLLVHCGHSADWKAVALMNVGHREGAPDDSRQHRDIGCLFQRLIPANCFEKLFIRKDHCVGPHARLVSSGDEPAVIVDFFEMHVQTSTKTRISQPFGVS